MRRIAAGIAVALVLCVLAPVPAHAAAAPAQTNLIAATGVGGPANWPSTPIVPRMAADETPNSTFALPETLYSGRPTWFNYCTYKNPAARGLWTDELTIDGYQIADVSVNYDPVWESAYFPHVNRGPVVMHGGIHTLTAYADLYFDVSWDIDFRWTQVPRTFTWSPEPLPAGAVTTCATTPPLAADDNDNNGYELDRTNANAFVVSGLADSAGSDVALRLYVDPWYGSTSGFSVLGAASPLGSGGVNLVVGSGAGTPGTVYPAVSARAYGAVGGYALSWADAAGHRDSTAAGRWSGSLGAMRMAGIYEVWLASGVPFRAALARTTGGDDLALALGPPDPGSYWGLDQALALSSPAGGTAAESLAFTPAETGWHPLVVYRAGTGDRANPQGYVLQFGAGTTGVGADAARFFLAAPSPNPATSPTRIAFGLARAGQVRLEIYDAQGRRVRTLADGTRPAGAQSAAWDLRDAQGAPVRAGLYWLRLEAAGQRRTARMVVAR